MKALLHPSAVARPLGLLGLALSGLMLLGFHQVVNGAMQRAEWQRAHGDVLAEQEAACAGLDEARRALCVLRAEQALAALDPAPADTRASDIAGARAR